MAQQKVDFNKKSARTGLSPLMTLLSGYSRHQPREQGIHQNYDKLQEAIVERLLQYGADPNAVGAYRRTPLQDAVRLGKVGLVRLLVEKGDALRGKSVAYKNDLLNSADNEAIAEQLLQYGADVNTVDSDGKTPLQNAVAQGKLGIVRLLVEKAGALNGASATYKSELLALAKNDDDYVDENYADDEGTLIYDYLMKQFGFSGESENMDDRGLGAPPTEPKKINDGLNDFFKITDKAQGKLVWVAQENAPATWEMRGLLIPSPGKKYFIKKLATLRLKEDIDFSFTEISAGNLVLSIKNIADPVFLPILGPAILPTFSATSQSAALAMM